MKSLDLNVATPEEVAAVLRNAAEVYYESQCELSAAWGDKNAGKCWQRFARILERAADQCDKVPFA